MRKGLLNMLGKTLVYGSISLLEHVLWTYCNLLGEVTEYKTVMCKGGVYDRLIELSGDLLKESKLRKVFAWFISNSLRGQPRLDPALVR